MARRYWVVHRESDEAVVDVYFNGEDRAEAVAEAMNNVSEAGGMGRPYAVK